MIPRSLRSLVAVVILWSAGYTPAQSRIGIITLSGSLTRADHKSLFEREFNVAAGVQRLKRMLNAGLKMTAIGGSDEHTADEKTDRAIGTPATIVYARQLSEPALVEGLRKGLAYVRTRGPSGPDLDFAAVSGDSQWHMGDTIPSSISEITLSVTTTRSAGQHLQWVRNGEIISTTIIEDGNTATLRLRPQTGDWFSVIFRDDAGPTLFSNAIYVSR